MFRVRTYRFAFYSHFSLLICLDSFYVISGSGSETGPFELVVNSSCFLKEISLFFKAFSSLFRASSPLLDKVRFIFNYKQK